MEKNKRQINGPQIYNEILKELISFQKRYNCCDRTSFCNARPRSHKYVQFWPIIWSLKGICSAMQLSMFFVRPAKWKKYFELIKTEKDASRTKVIEIFPYISSQLSRKKDSNKADAVLIASFFYNTYKKAD